ncbi:cytochrome c oxidase assembly protein [Agrobacterium rubi]|uniref:Cytochrome c oxidase assembly protein CtaG n=1 Tax=Agrobacterium rubi TR3 = NBRC 13261 TaxID=1368415 RepID=A0A081CYS0_9HYPH|nr:cytochrome c oxidase assembly protein [Agrobacterium rubi]MBP1880040.1 cytochrome c oxidase assembly protein subunit 11 [Agrobacterium rubi]MCL6653881.1 cytochrome C oxidase assembly protein [Agrobacterium rubi]NTF06653.1 cytochrome c oxidase assembly protein [Agrobacterium rubi]NTF18895.1 cytochrome c oxidase assembly protein [Agrobacterium rubi]NTF25858.1 cytochrome c oxidase assembly protein [Agrobacterium rubi]
MAATGTTAKKTSNGSILVLCVVFVCGMVGMAYASVPLYRLFCQVTGYNGTTQRVEQYSDVILDKKMKVTFDSNTSNGLNWDFRPVDRSVEPRIGETVQVMFRATNRSPVATTGSAVFNVTPMEAGAYFNKVQCFCFTETTLQPGETLEMPVVFFIDPEIVKARETKGIHTLTLSYTFYPAKTEKPVASLPVKTERDETKL